MTDTPCIFCKIGSHQAPATVVFENAEFIAFRDINPEAPTHVLVVPKEHINLFSELWEEKHAKKLQSFLGAIGETVRILGIGDNFKLSLHNGKAAGQLVPHVHFHVLSQKTT